MVERRSVVVVGGGVHGLCTAFALHRAGVRDILLIDARSDGHMAGSSHGETRITRTSYGEERWIRLAIRAHREGWPQLQSALGTTLLLPTPGLFFGPPDGPFGRFLRATEAAGAPVERMTLVDVRRRFPLLRIDDGDACLLDHSAAVVAAARTMAGLRAWCDAHGIERRSSVPVRSLRRDGDRIVLECEAEQLGADRVVVAAGAGLVELMPELANGLEVLKQDVGYFAPRADDATDRRPGAFPVWARIGMQPNDFVYGLPEFGRPGLKLARHRTHGDGDDAFARQVPADQAGLAALAAERFAIEVDCVGSETCLYTMAPEEELRVLRHPTLAGVVVVAACSGHSFKFAPELGRMAAEAVLSR
ncbi:MAG: hypothetical protein RL398_705 [Planctomycetota bacterium]|jgi:glycine/D-amino acid oxidase-like deaminating enzyme